MNVDEMLGGVLFRAADLDAATVGLTSALLAVGPTPEAIRELGLDPELVDAVRGELPKDAVAIAAACRSGAAWVRGRRSRPTEDSWEAVLSMPNGWALPEGVRRTTAETLSGLVTESRRQVRFVAPFFDVVGARYLSEAIAAATARRVRVQLLLPPDTAAKGPAIAVLESVVAERGVPDCLSIVAAAEDHPWPHLKVMVSDGTAAYVGSANITGPGLGGRNLELGVLVRGPQAAVIDRVIDLVPLRR